MACHYKNSMDHLEMPNQAITTATKNAPIINAILLTPTPHASTWQPIQIQTNGLVSFLSFVFWQHQIVSALGQQKDY
jgi:hypothetical protein